LSASASEAERLAATPSVEAVSWSLSGRLLPQTNLAQSHVGLMMGGPVSAVPCRTDGSIAPATFEDGQTEV
jgi:hypothetical protein